MLQLSISSTKVQVTNDSYSINFNFTVHVKHQVGSQDYSCSYGTSNILVNYTKVNVGL